MPKVSDESLKVKQYQYISWPHHSVPDNAGSFISFCKTAVAPNNDTSMGPMVVHDRYNETVSFMNKGDIPEFKINM